MPTWTSQVIYNDPRISERRQQNFNNLMGVVNQIASLTYNIQQAKQAEDIKKLSIVAEGAKFVPKDQLPEYFNQNFMPLAKKFGIEVNPIKVNPDKVKELSDKVLLALKDPNPTTRMVNLAVIGKNSGLADEGAALVKNLTEAVNQQQLAENVATLQGQGQIKQVPFAKGIPTEQTPEFPFRTALDIPRPQDALNALRLSEEGRKIISTLTPKEKTGGKRYVNADTGERKTFYPGDEMTGNWYELGGEPKPDKITVSKLDKDGSVLTKDISPVNFEEHLKAGWSEGRITARPWAPEKKEKLTMTDVRSAYSMEVGNIKNRMMVDMAPEEQANISGQPAENVLALILSGKIGRSLSPEKKAGYIKELRQVESYYSGLTNQVLGRKGAKPPIQSGSKSGMSSLIDFFKRAKTKEDAIGRIKSAIKQGWTKEQLQKAERQAGWAW